MSTYKDSMKSDDRVSRYAIRGIINRIRDHEKNQLKITPEEIIYSDKNIIKILKETALESIEVAVELIKINPKDKEILRQVEGHKHNAEIILGYLPDGEIEKFEVEYFDKIQLIALPFGGNFDPRHPSPSHPESSKHKTTKSDNKAAGSFGSGFFVSNKGHIITNFHVIKNSNNIKFLFNDDEIDAQLIASDQQLDLALLKSKVQNKNYIKFSNKSPQKAQNILVAGFPFGKVISDDLKITGGIINSLKGGGNDTTRFQLDATVNPGNSGGPIVDKLSGSLVGVAVTKLSKDFTKAVFGVEGETTNYGIKASQVKDFLEANNLKVSIKKSKFKVSDLENSTVFIYNK